MTPVNLYYEVESAFVQMDHALENAQKHATPEGKLLYEHLMDELIGIRDRARQDLLDLHTKKAAPAAGTTETAKSDSGKESIFSLDEKEDDVKRSHLNLTVIADKTVEVDLSINGPNEHLLNLYTAAVEALTAEAPSLWLNHADLEKAYKTGHDRGIKRIEAKAKKEFSQISESAQDALLRLAKELNIPDDLLLRLTGGAEK